MCKTVYSVCAYARGLVAWLLQDCTAVVPEFCAGLLLLWAFDLQAAAIQAALPYLVGVLLALQGILAQRQSEVLPYAAQKGVCSQATLSCATHTALGMTYTLMNHDIRVWQVIDPTRQGLEGAVGSVHSHHLRPATRRVGWRVMLCYV